MMNCPTSPSAGQSQGNQLSPGVGAGDRGALSSHVFNETDVCPALEASARLNIPAHSVPSLSHLLDLHIWPGTSSMAALGVSIIWVQTTVHFSYKQIWD